MNLIFRNDMEFEAEMLKDKLDATRYDYLRHKYIFSSENLIKEWLPLAWEVE